MEFEYFSETITVNDRPLAQGSESGSGSAEPVIYSVVKIQNANGPEIAVSGNVITISGEYENNFQQSIAYLDTDRNPAVVTGFNQLPEQYFIVSNYTAPAVSTITAEYAVFRQTVNDPEGILTPVGQITQSVINNYTPGRDSLKAAVAKGQK